MSIVGKDSLFRNSVRWRIERPSNLAVYLLFLNNIILYEKFIPTLFPTGNSMARCFGSFSPYPLPAALSNAMVNSNMVCGDAIAISDRTGPPSAPVIAVCVRSP